MDFIGYKGQGCSTCGVLDTLGCVFPAACVLNTNICALLSFNGSEVSLKPSHAVSFQPHPEHDKEAFSSLEDLSCTCA
eukprot:scaffold251208_cov17-Tisochrysis_lutea.AAC.1